MTGDPSPLDEVLKRLALGEKRPEDIDELKQAIESGRVTRASNGGVAIGGDVSGGIVAGTLMLPPEILKLLQPAYQPPPVPSPEILAEPGDPPFGSRIPFSPNAVFIGRREDLLELALVLLNGKDGSDRSVVIAGMGGLGKTQLAVEFCYRYGRFFQGVHWLQANLDMQSEVAENGRAMNLPYWPDKLPEQVQATLRSWHEGGLRLIVLDYVENLRVILDWLPRLRPACLLITSRRDDWPVDLGLEVKSMKVLSRSQSIELLRKLAPRLKGISDEQLDKLASHLGYLPMALDLAGRYLADRSELSIEGYMGELDEAGSVLEHTSLIDWVEDLHSPTGHPPSMAVTFALSWQQLTETDVVAKKLFRVGGYCAPNRTIPRRILKEAMGTDVPDRELDRALRKLDSLGLIDRSEGGLRMHNLVAEFARIQDRDATESVLPPLAKAVVKLTTEAIESGLPKNMEPLRDHLDHVAQATGKTNHELAGVLWNNLSTHLRNLADYQGSKVLAERALKIDEKVYGPDHPNVARDVDSLGRVLQAMGDLNGAKELCERALRIDETAYGPDHPDVARDLNNLGRVLQAMGDWSGAKKNFERALKIDEKVFGPDHPNVAIRSNNLGSVLHDMGDLNGAKENYERALNIGEKKPGPDHPTIAIRSNNLGLLLKDMGDLDGAKEYCGRALQIDEKVYGPDHPNVAIRVNNIGRVLQAMGDLNGAREHFERALEIDAKIYGPDHPDVAIRVNNIGRVLQAMGDLNGAKEHFERALKIFQNRLGENHPRTKAVLSQLESLKIS